MKPSLQLNISQQLTLTPQLQQAIRLLQLSTLDLQQEIQQAVESNPLLEAVPQEEKQESTHVSKKSEDEFSDFQWAQLYTAPGKRTSFDEPDYNFENLYSTTTNLHDHLNWQLGLTPMSDIDRAIATALIDSMDDDGFLTSPLEDILNDLNSEAYPLDLDELEAVRHRLQLFDPVGCVSTSLADALLIQLQQHNKKDSIVKLAKAMIEKDIDLLGQHNYRQLMKNHGAKEAELNKALQLIQGLNPRPGSVIFQGKTEYITPDILVKKVDGVWQAQLNQYTLPRLSINQHYAGMIKRANNSSDNQFLKSNLQEARWFLKSIQSRQETLLKVARSIVEYQQDFLEHGPEAMKPLILSDVARALDMHESTISRVTTQKFMHTPRGVFELKYFFSSHVATATGGECSSTAIRAVIKKLIAAENSNKPLSDSKIAKLIEEQGIHVARRTIAKYREALGIPPSNERKSIGN